MPQNQNIDNLVTTLSSETTGPGNSDKDSIGKWLIGIAVCLGLWLAISGGQNKKTYSPPSATAQQGYNAPQSTPVPAVTPTPSGEPQSSGLQYTKPSAGTNNLLAVPEIQWCIRENIRIDAMRNLIETNAGIDEFNRIVNDYNSRCGNYRYRQGTQSQAERSVEPYHSQIVAEAVREAKQLGRPYQPSSPPVSSTPLASSTPAKPAESGAPEKPSAQYIREAQQLLTDLGYKLGPVDGDYGRRTADAVKAFQQKLGILQDGQIDQNLLSLLRSTANQRVANIEGEYKYADTTSMQGGFTIKREGAHYAIELHLVSIQTMHFCKFGSKGKLEDNVLNFDARSDQRKAGVRIVFSSTGAELEDIGGAHMSWCSFRARMAGKYLKTAR
jgi:hypothetical protein